MLCDSTYIRDLKQSKIIGTQSTVVVSRGWGRKEWGVKILIDIEFGFSKMELWRWMVVMAAEHYEYTPEIYTLKWLRW